MLAHLEGNIMETRGDFVILSIGGVGYKVHLLPSIITSCKAGAGKSFYTHLAVRENALDLYGFTTHEELDFFEMIISVSGIGPRSGLAILSLATIETLRLAIGSGDTSYLTKVSGIGRKTAEKIVLELKDKIGAVERANGSPTLTEETEALEALRSLGYSQSEARDALRAVPEGTLNTNERLKEALKRLSR
jgi:holliday junction DNA helicase RuvA